MSVCGQTEEESASEDGAPAPVQEMHEAKAVSKVVRVLTVLAYLLSVSLAAILLSVYYVCVWQSPKLPPLNDTGEGELAALRAGPQPEPDTQTTANSTAYNTTSATAAGGGDTTVSEAPTPATATPPLDSLPASTDTDPPDPYAPPPDSYTQNSIYNATDVNITDPWPTWIMSTVNDTGQR